MTKIFLLISAFDLRSKGFIGAEIPNKLAMPSNSICANCETEKKSDKSDPRYLPTKPILAKIPTENLIQREDDKNTTKERIYTNSVKMNASKLKDLSPVTWNGSNISKFAIPFEVYCSQLVFEDWYHGKLDRCQAEALLKKDGDFLVHEAPDAPKNFVLTGLSSDNIRHFLLIDEESGFVRTKDRMFESISHLINYHCINRFPIISSGEVFQLKCAVVCLKTLRRVKNMSEPRTC